MTKLLNFPFFSSSFRQKFPPCGIGFLDNRERRCSRRAEVTGNEYSLYPASYTTNQRPESRQRDLPDQISDHVISLLQ